MKIFLNFHLLKKSTNRIEETNRSSTERFEEMMKSSPKKEDKLSRGDKVIARNDLLGYYYSGKLYTKKKLNHLFNFKHELFKGKVSKVIDSRHANIKFDKGPKQEGMSIRNIIKAPGVTPYLSVIS